MPESTGYQALRNSAALVESPTRARVRVTGEKRLALLHRMTTQDLNSLRPGQGRTAVLLTDKARIVDHLTVYALEEEARILSARSDAAPSLLHLKHYTLRDDFKPQEETSSSSLLCILGPRAVEVLTAAGLEEASTLPDVGIRRLPDGDGFLLSTDGPCRRNLALWVTAERAAHWRDHLLEAGSATGLRAATSEDYEAVRIENGHAAYGSELSEEINPLEAGLGGSISWDKGCYIGQEVVARLDTYQKVQRHLVGLRLPGAVGPPPAGSKLLMGGQPAGWVTSAIDSPALGEPVALGYVKTAHTEAGTALQVLAGSETLEARVAALPLVS